VTGGIVVAKSRRGKSLKVYEQIGGIGKGSWGVEGFKTVASQKKGNSAYTKLGLRDSGKKVESAEDRS